MCQRMHFQNREFANKSIAYVHMQHLATAEPWHLLTRSPRTKSVWFLCSNR